MNLRICQKAADVANNEDIWPKIQEDFEHAYDNLSETQSEIERANKWARPSYLGKALHNTLRRYPDYRDYS